MIHLIYTSIERQEFSSPDLKKLLIRARARNTSASVTGMLIYHSGVFLQALEGDDAGVSGTFARIEIDSRHRDLKVLHRQATLGQRRMFGKWSMGFADEKGASHILRGFIELNNAVRLTSLDKISAMEVLRKCSREALQQPA
jgi:hypothetical protein